MGTQSDDEFNEYVRNLHWEKDVYVAAVAHANRVHAEVREHMDAAAFPESDEPQAPNDNNEPQVD